MIVHDIVCQPYEKVTNSRLFEHALKNGQIGRLDVAVAYATPSGVRTMIEIMSTNDSDAWDRMKKRWLIGIDWCRTDPSALDSLAAMPQSSVKIFDGSRVVNRPNCTPKLPYHPKGFILHGSDRTAVIAGSGNLSRNGLLRGHELGSVLVCGSPTNALERALNESCNKVVAWFEAKWKGADSYSSLRSAYLSRYESSDNLKAPPPTEDDSVASDELDVGAARRGALTTDQLKKMRVARHFWIRFVKNQNRGRGVPGSQLMMSRMMRVFFGFPAEDLQRNSTIGMVTISYDNFVDSFSLRFSDNAMDVLNLPVPGRGGPASYDGEILMFERQGSARGNLYFLTIGNAAQIRDWERRSSRIGASYRMSSGRPWGVF